LDILKAQTAGDAMAVAQARLMAAQHQFEVLDAQHKVGVVGPTEYQTARNLLDLRQAELKAAETRKTVPVLSEREKEIARSNLNSRVKVAMQIMSINDRDTALVRVARDAAAAGEGAIARSALIAIVNMNTRDSVSSEVSRALTQSGQLSSALDIASMMTSLNSRDPALAEIARAAAKSRDADLAKKAVMRIMSLNTRDETAHQTAMQLAGAGMRTEAQDIARLIVNMNMRDQTFSELAK
jgi:outer membrane protein TolC